MDNYISKFEVNLEKIIDYVFHDIPQSEEISMENYFDNHEELADTVESLLDFCLEQQMSKFMVKHFIKNQSSQPLNTILLNIETQLSSIATEDAFASEVDTTEILEAEHFVSAESYPVKIGKRFIKVVFTLLLVLNIPFWQSYSGDYSNSSLLKASQKEKVQQMMTLSAYEIEYMRVDMLDERPITDFMTIVAIPSTFELRYVTAD